MKDLESKDPKQAKSMFKAFAKHRAKEDKEASSMKFSIFGYMQEWQASEGRRIEAQHEMMWEGEFLEFAKTAKAGFLSRQEAEGLWKEYETAGNVSRDMKGPRGYLRCAIKVKDVLNQFEEVKRSQTAKREAKFGKNTTDDVFAVVARMLRALLAQCYPEVDHTSKPSGGTHLRG